MPDGWSVVKEDATPSGWSKVEAAPKEEQSAGQRFVEGAASNLNPLAALSALAHPIDTVGNLIDAHVEQAKKAKQAYDEGRYSEAVGHLGAAALPVLGPAAAAAGEKIGQGEDIAGGLGEGAGLIGSVFTPKLVPRVAKVAARAGGAAIGAVGDVVTHPVVTSAAAKAVPNIVKHGATGMGAAAGGMVAGAPGAMVGGYIGRELGAGLAERMKGVAPAAAADAALQTLAADLVSGKAPLQELAKLPPELRGAVLEARQAAVKAAPAAESPLALSRRMKAEAMDAAGGEQAAKEAVYGPPEPPAAPQAQPSAPAPVVAPAPAQPAAALSEGPKAKLLDPDYARSPQRMLSELGIQARRLGVKLTDEQLQAGVEAIKQGARPDAVARQFAPVDPAAALAAKLGTPTPEMVAARVAERNRTGRWPGAPNGKQILARANPPN